MKRLMPKLNLIISSFYITLFLLSIHILPAQHNLLLRLGGGYYREFSGYGRNELVHVNNPYVTISKIHNPPVNNLLFEVEVEYIYLNKLSIKSGYLFNMGTAVGFKNGYISKADLNTQGQNYEIRGSEFITDFELRKYPLYFQYKIADIWFKPVSKPSGKITIWPMLGFSFNRFAYAKYARINEPEPIYSDYMFEAIDGTQVRVIDLNFVKRRNSGSVYFGVNTRVHTKKAELFSILFSYEQGFYTLVERQSTIEAAGINYVYSTSSKGSNFNVRLSFPVFSYNFTKKKFYRD